MERVNLFEGIKSISKERLKAPYKINYQSLLRKKMSPTRALHHHVATNMGRVGSDNLAPPNKSSIIMD
jgi:hypothetical protein